MLTVAECMIVVSLKVVALVLSLLSSSCHKHGMKVRRVFAAKHLDETREFEMKSIRLSHCVHMKLCCVCLMVCVFIPPTRYGHFSGINRKVQLTYLRNGKPKASSEEEGIVLRHRLLCVLGHRDKLYVNKYTQMVIGSECQCHQLVTVFWSLAFSVLVAPHHGQHYLSVWLQKKEF